MTWIQPLYTEMMLLKGVVRLRKEGMMGFEVGPTTFKNITGRIIIIWVSNPWISDGPELSKKPHFDSNFVQGVFWSRYDDDNERVRNSEGLSTRNQPKNSSFLLSCFMIFQIFSASLVFSTLKNHQICQKVGKKWRKLYFNLP